MTEHMIAIIVKCVRRKTPRQRTEVDRISARARTCKELLLQATGIGLSPQSHRREAPLHSLARAICVILLRRSSGTSYVSAADEMGFAGGGYAQVKRAEESLRLGTEALTMLRQIYEVAARDRGTWSKSAPEPPPEPRKPVDVEAHFAAIREEHGLPPRGA